MTTRLISLTLAIATIAPAWSADYVPRPKRSAKAAPVTAQIWRPGTQTTYENYGSWELTEISRFTYDRQGRQLTQYLDSYSSNGEIGSRSLYTYEYGNDNSRFTRRQTDTSTDGVYYDPSTLTVRRYDERVPSVIIENTESIWSGAAWVERGNCYRREIERDLNGNITRVTVSVPYEGEYSPMDRLTITYGEDGRPATMLHEVLTQGTEPGTFVWGVSQEYLDCVWDECNGQITAVEDLPYGGNRLSSARIRVAEGVYGTLNFTYPDEMGSYRSVQKFVDNGLVKNVIGTMTVLDEYGSYDFTVEEISGLGSMIERYAETERYHLDEYGNETLIYTSVTENGIETIYGWMRGESEYNALHGYPEVYTVSERDPDTGDFEPRMRVEFADYIDAAGVTSVETDSSAEPEYYDLRGIRIENPTAPGIYIRRTGTQADKIIVR